MSQRVSKSGNREHACLALPTTSLVPRASGSTHYNVETEKLTEDMLNLSVEDDSYDRSNLTESSIGQHLPEDIKKSGIHGTLSVGAAVDLLSDSDEMREKENKGKGGIIRETQQWQEGAKCTRFISDQQRHVTFRNWPFPEVQPVERLVRAGYWYSGTLLLFSSRKFCFFCCPDLMVDNRYYGGSFRTYHSNIYIFCYPKQKKMCFCFPKQNKIFDFVSASKNIFRFLFPQLNISLCLFPQVKIFLLAETKTKNMFTCRDKN